MGEDLLVVDDELAESHEPDVRQLRALVEAAAGRAGLRCQYVGTGMEAFAVVSGSASLAAVILDRTFSEKTASGDSRLQTLQGIDILRGIRRARPSLPVVVLTRSDSFTEAEQFIAEGADRYVVKASFVDRSAELTNFLSGLRDDPSNDRVVLHVIPRGVRECDIYIMDSEGHPVLKRSRRLSTPLAQIILGCAIDNADRCVEFPEQDAHGIVRGLEPFQRTDIQKVVYAFNRSLVTSSGGRLQPLLHGGTRLRGSSGIQSVYGRSAFCLMIGRVEIHDVPQGGSHGGLS